MVLWSALRELGLRQAGLFTLYRLGLNSGHYRRACDAAKAVRQVQGVDSSFARPLWQLPPAGELQSVLGEAGCAQLLAQADEIVAGQVRLFGGPPRALQLAPSGPLAHWTDYERGETYPVEGAESDIKWVWEPARLGWAYTLGRAYLLSQDENYAATFWRWIETFLEANPPYLGPHWASAQEVALRLIALTFSWQVFGATSGEDPQRATDLVRAVAIHARRIPPTLVYARAQNNNHLLSEAAGLLTAGLFLPGHPEAARWRRLGWRWFNRGIQAQVASDGGYMQHSTSYHRLMLQIALWVNFLAESQGQTLPVETQERLAAATGWLLKLLDSESGCVPNLGPNDGAYILPLTVCPQGDYRPVLQAAATAFLGEQPFAGGPWDEMEIWLGNKQAAGVQRHLQDREPSSGDQPPHVLRSADGSSWAYLRAARFAGRPGHADQLHFDLWWRGINVAQDAGTYSYNAAPPWENSLARSEAHNTVTVNGQDQMRRAGRFLYVDWAQAEILHPGDSQEGLERRLSARHNGYRRIGVWHQREVTVNAGGEWQIRDTISSMRPLGSEAPVTACLHWLLPDWPWEVQAGPISSEIQLGPPDGLVRLHLTLEQASEGMNAAALQIARAGERLYGDGPVQPTWGWSSPTYGLKAPALSIRFTASGGLPIHFTTQFVFPAVAAAEKP